MKLDMHNIYFLFLDRISAAVFRGTAAIIAEGVQRATSNHAKL